MDEDNQKEPSNIEFEKKSQDILDYIFDENFFADEQNKKLREEFFNTKITRLFLVPKVQKIEDSIRILIDDLRKNDISLEKLSYAIKTHEKQILVLERFIENQNIKNEQLHLEIASLKIVIESIQAQTTAILGFIEEQNSKNSQVHLDICELKASVENIQGQSSSILNTIERISRKFDIHIDELERYFLNKAATETDQSLKDIKQYKFLIKIGYWIAGTLGTISFISLSIYSHLSGKSFTQFILEVVKMMPWNQ